MCGGALLAALATAGLLIAADRLSTAGSHTPLATACFLLVRRRARMRVLGARSGNTCMRLLSAWGSDGGCRRGPHGCAFRGRAILLARPEHGRDLCSSGLCGSAVRLADEMLRLRSLGALNINLVTPTHFTDRIVEALDLIKDELDIPVVWNTSGYEKPETVASLKGYCDVFLTDFKYSSPALSEKYSHAADYAEYAAAALCEMVKITGAPRFEGQYLKRGTVVRHLVLPGASRDSEAVLRTVDEAVGAKNVILSLMSQYTPSFVDEGYPELSRKITTFEYERARDFALSLGFEGYAQSKRSATSAYTPDFGKEDA